ncbi:hypothetical protein ACTL6U_05690 [Rhodovibrionaceae bacterium A322]
MPHNFVMLFFGKEGSSAYISHLSNHPQITIPLFEDLDRYRVGLKHVPEDVAEKLPQAIDQIFETGQFDATKLFEDRSKSTRSTNREQGSSVGFKWRIWGDPKQMIPVFKQHNVCLLNIQRRSFANLMFSIYVTEVAKNNCPKLQPYRAPLLQFELAAANNQERAELSEAINGLKFKLEPEKLWRFADGFLENLRFRRDALEVFSAAGLPSHTIFHEDFSRDPEQSLKRTLQVLGLEYHPNVQFTGLTPVLEQDPLLMAENVKEVLNHPRFVEKETEWNLLRDQILTYGRVS